MNVADIRREMLRLATPRRRAVNLTFFKCGPGEYGEGDKFMGLSVPQVREVHRRFRELPNHGVGMLVESRFHEERLLGLMFIVDRYRRGDAAQKERWYRQYLASFPHINNWDLVDGSAEHVVGPHLENRDKAPLWKWARSKRLWDRRIAMLATFAYIKKGRFAESLRLVRMFLCDPEDLMHKACGWMLREIGKRDVRVLRKFLGAYSTRMPRTMLRYAIERFPERERRAWLAK
jgi:3-methyladenine DNA glycosylase AlkD